MTMRPGRQSARAGERARGWGKLLRPLAAGVLGLACALLVSCASSGKGLIPASAAGPLRGDFEAVQQTAESANGSCGATEAALVKTAEDFAALPNTVDAGLRNNLRQGIDNLRQRAHELCSQPSAQTVTTITTTKSTPPPTTTTSTQPSTTQTTSTSTTPVTPSPGGGTPVPEEGEEPSEQADGKGGSGEGGSGGVGAGGKEAGK